MRSRRLRRVYQWSWLVTLPITAVFLYWATTTLEIFHRFGVVYDSRPFRITLENVGRLDAYALLLQARLAVDPRVPSLRRDGTLLRRVHLFVSEAALSELDENLPHSGFQYVPASILDGGKLRKVSFRYRGDFASHWWGPKKSLRVKTKKGQMFEGVRTFNLVLPKFAAQLNDDMGYRLAARMGLLAPKSEMVDVTINGEWMGVYLFVEQPSEQTLREHGLMPGDVYAGELVAKDAYVGVSSNVFEHPSLWEKIAVNNHFDEASLEPLRALLALLREGVSAEEVHRGLAELLDMEAWGRFSAFETLAQTLHYDQAHNWRLYFDPARSRFIPLVWDPTAWHRNWMPRAGKPLRLDTVSSDLHALLFTNGDFLRARNAAFESFFRDGESDAFLSEFEELMERTEPSIRVDPHPYSFPGMDIDGPAAKVAAMRDLAQAVRGVLRDVRRAFLDESGEVLHAMQPDGRGLALSVAGRSGVRRIVLRYAKSLSPEVARAVTSAHIRYWRGEELVEVDVSGALAIGRNRIEIATTLLPRYTVTDTGKRTVMRYQVDVRPAYYEVVLGASGNVLPVPLEVLVDRGASDLEESRRVPTLARVPFGSDYAVVKADPSATLEVWQGIVEVNEVRRIRHELLIRPGTTVRFGPGAGLILEARLLAEGRAGAPIRFVPASADQAPWGALVLLGRGANGSRLAHCEIEGGSGFKAPLFEYSAMLSVHDVERVKVRNCAFRDSKIVDDMVHAVYAEIRFTDSTFTRAKSDGVDLDLSQGHFERCRFEAIGNDGIDLMTSQALVLDSVFEGTGDKGISNGEGSHLLAINNRFSGNQIGVQSKDGSVAVLYNVEIHDSQRALDAYEKNWQYDSGGSIFVYKGDIEKSVEGITADKLSRIEIYDSYVAADVAVAEDVVLDGNVDRDAQRTSRERNFARAVAEQAAFGDPFPSTWDRARPERRGVAFPR